MRLRWAWAPSLCALLAAVPAAAQRDLVWEMRELRTAVRAQEVLAEIGRAARLRPPHWFRPDSAGRGGARGEAHGLFWWLPPGQRPPAAVRHPIGYAPPPPPAAPPPPLAEVRWKRVPGRLHDRWVARHAEAVWLPEGLWTDSGALTVTPMDTVRTGLLRAKLTSLFGPPTRTVLQAEGDGLDAGAFGQFEYWFAVNDTIPVHVMDRNGPFGRGLVVAGAREHRRWLPQIKRDLARRLARHERAAPYVDYYHDRDGGQWWRTGHDGERLFAEPTRRPRRR